MVNTRKRGQVIVLTLLANRGGQGRGQNTIINTVASKKQEHTPRLPRKAL